MKIAERIHQFLSSDVFNMHPTSATPGRTPQFLKDKPRMRAPFSPLRSKLRLLLQCSAIGSLLLLQACASAGRVPVPSDSRMMPNERGVFELMKQADAQPAQQDIILAAFDEFSPKLKTVNKTLEDLDHRWERLDAHSPGYQAEVDKIADAVASGQAERLRLMGQFDAKVAGTLDEKQWKAWRKALASQHAPQGRGGMGGPGGMDGGPGGGGPGGGGPGGPGG